MRGDQRSGVNQLLSLRVYEPLFGPLGVTRDGYIGIWSIEPRFFPLNALVFLAPRRKLGCPMTCRSRSYRLSALVVASLVSIPAMASAADLPPIRASETNQVADCATPGRLTVYLKQRNPNLNPRYDGLAGEYKRFGQELNLRWDYAFFQMLLETGYLTYGGDVKPEQNNFAGLGATGKGARGESFSDISAGARAHLEHLLMYSGARVENPVAERTRNIQEWGVLTKWQASLSGPITFQQLAGKWAPGSRRYATDIQAIADRFFDGVCHDPDPDAAVVAAAEEDRGPPTKVSTAEETTSQLPPADQKNSKPAATATATAIPSGFSKSASNVTLPSKTAAAASNPPAAKSSEDKPSASPPITLLNPEPSVSDAPAEAVAGSVEEAAETAKTSGKSVEVAALPGAIGGAGAGAAEKKSDPAPQKQGSEKKPDKKATEKKSDKKDAGAANGKCRVWTASYGGSKAIIIRASSDKTTNYTVLDVNEGAEKREADAYINAYAKGGQSVGEFSSQAQALEKAFELCPEG